MALWLPFSLRFCLKTIMALKASQFQKNLEYFLPICLWSLSLVGVLKVRIKFITSIKTCTKCSSESRSLKSSVFLYLEGFKYMFPMKVALGMKLPLRGYSREEPGLWSLAALLTTPLFHFIAKSLCLLQQLSHKDSYHSSAVFLSHFLCLTGHKGTVSAAQDSQSPSCWWQHRTGLFHLLSKYSTNTGH